MPPNQMQFYDTHFTINGRFVVEEIVFLADQQDHMEHWPKLAKVSLLFVKVPDLRNVG